MLNKDQLKLLLQGVAAWNRWRKENPDGEVDLRVANLWGANLRWADLRMADLRMADLRMANLSGANLSGANLMRADLRKAKLSGADLRKAKLSGADLWEANLSRTNLSGANLWGANLSRTKLTGTDLSVADLSRASLIETTLVRTKLTGCRIYGISVWGLKPDETEQRDLIITPEDQPTVTVDNIEVAQFVYLLLHNEKIRDVIGTVAKKAVLILGRFAERKVVLDAIKEELRKRGYLPILFDFERSEDRDIAETVSILAHMARFIIVDITDPRSVPAELAHIVPNLPSVPVASLILDSQNPDLGREYALFEHIRRYHWVLEPYRYKDPEALLGVIGENVIEPAERKVDECRKELGKIRDSS
jgi:uncharacterized protein YjbI with pentapeptide repeats